MDKSKAFRVDWYPREAFMDFSRLTAEEIGVLMQIINLIYSHNGPIGNDPKYIGKSCGITRSKCNRIIEGLVIKGEIYLDETDKINKKRCEYALKEIEERRKKYSENGKKGSELRWGCELNQEDKDGQAISCDVTSTNPRTHKESKINTHTLYDIEKYLTDRDRADFIKNCKGQDIYIYMCIFNEEIKGSKCYEAWPNFSTYIRRLEYGETIRNALEELRISFNDQQNRNRHGSLIQEPDILERLEIVKTYLLEQSEEQAHTRIAQESADKPVFFPVRSVLNPELMIEASADEESNQNNLANWLRGLQLRLKNRLHDRRWDCFRNYEELQIQSFKSWLERLGVGPHSSDVVVIDCSMIANEVLPYITGILGRLVLELREHIEANKRYYEPWVLVLEEAHNYIRPRRQVEDRGLIISREAFERVAKEGRKFGLSLIVASQRPSEISPTVISQCANFVMHRLQNPDDIEHFQRIVPSQSRRLLDQVTILAPGEALLVGSAFHVPARAKIKLPNPKPSSSSSMPYHSWQKPVRQRFDLQAALNNWIGDTSQN